MLSFVLHIISASAAFIATVFFMIGTIAYGTTSSVVENTAWMTVDQDGIKIFLGLRKVYVEYQGNSGTIAIDDSDLCTSSICDTCSRDGKGAFGLMCGATVFAAVTVALCCTLMGVAHKDSNRLHTSSILISLLSLVCGAVALGLYMGDCYKAIDDNADGVDVEWGPGSALTIVGVILLGIACVCEAVSSCQPIPASETHQDPAKAKPVTPDAPHSTAVDNHL